MENANQKHLILEDRNYIEQALNHGMTFKEIAKFLSKDPITISKGIKKHRIKKEPNTFNGCGNICKNRFSCRRKNVCGRNCNFLCFKCKRCNTTYCSDFQEDICLILTQALYVCNSCSSKSSCRLVKYYYHALPSYHQYKHTLSTSRQGINLSSEELCELDNTVSPLIKQGQTISHIYQTQNLKCSKSSLYNYINQNQLSSRNIDLPRRIRFSTKKSNKKFCT